MKTQMKEILSIIWKYSRLWGCMKLLNSVLTAIIVPVNTVLLQRIVDDILILLYILTGIEILLLLIKENRNI